MLTQNQINEIKEHLEKAQNPLFYYDNDCDGLCSFLLLRRYIGRGKGVAVRSFPELDAQYARKARELNADYVFILDKPVVSRDFVEEIDRLQLPLVWIDHHNVSSPDLKEFKNLFIYNPTKNKEKSEEPVTYWAYQIAKRKEDIWLAVIGCVADHHLPGFAEEFASEFPEFWGKVKKPFDAYYKTEIGRIAQALNFGLKDSTTNIIHLQNFLITCKGPQDVFLEVTANQSFRKKYTDIRKKYDLLLEEAKQEVSGNLIFFEYSGEISMSSDLSNELSYIYPDKYIAVIYKKGGISNISLRGRKVKGILENIIKKIENMSGGGHEDAVGARIKTDDINKFKSALLEQIGLK